jgi:hypothetical protein
VTGEATLVTVGEQGCLQIKLREVREPTWHPLTPSCEEVGKCPPPLSGVSTISSGPFASRHARQFPAATLRVNMMTLMPFHGSTSRECRAIGMLAASVSAAVHRLPLPQAQVDAATWLWTCRESKNVRQWRLLCQDGERARDLGVVLWNELSGKSRSAIAIWLKVALQRHLYGKPEDAPACDSIEFLSEAPHPGWTDRDEAAWQRVQVQFLTPRGVPEVRRGSLARQSVPLTDCERSWRRLFASLETAGFRTICRLSTYFSGCAPLVEDLQDVHARLQRGRKRPGPGGVKGPEPDYLDRRVYRRLCQNLTETMQSNTRGKIRSQDSGRTVANRVVYNASVLRRRLEQLPPTQCVSAVNLTNIPVGFSNWIAAIPQSESSWNLEQRRSAAIGALDDLVEKLKGAERRLQQSRKVRST